jgi:hypothetical protein
MPPEQLTAANRIIDESAVAAGRSPRDVIRLYNIDWAPGRSGSGFLQGPPRAVAEQLADITLSQGMSCYILYHADSADVIRQFAAEVARPCGRQSPPNEPARSGKRAAESHIRPRSALNEPGWQRSGHPGSSGMAKGSACSGRARFRAGR